MKRFLGIGLMVILLSVGFLLSPCSVTAVEVGSITETRDRVVDKNGKTMTVFNFAWTADGAGVVSGIDSTDMSGLVTLGVTTPGAPAPTADYDITFLDAAGSDVFGGTLADRSDTLVQQKAPASGQRPVYGKCQLTIANAGAGAKGVLKVYVLGFEFKADPNSTVLVESFGAVGDGVTDDTAAIQAAIDAGTGRITLGAKTYLTSALTFTGNDVHIEGAGATSILKMQDATGFVLSRGNAPTGSALRPIFRNFAIDMDSKGDAGIWLEGVWYGHVENVTITNLPAGTFSYDDAAAGGAQTYSKCGIGIKGVTAVSGAYYNLIERCMVSGVDASTYGNTGYYLTSTTAASTTRANSNRIVQCRAVYCAVGVDIVNGGDVEVYKPEVSWCDYGVKTNCARTAVIEYYAENQTYVPVYVGASAEYCMIGPPGSVTTTDGKTYITRSITGTYTPGEVVGDGTRTATLIGVMDHGPLQALVVHSQTGTLSGTVTGVDSGATCSVAGSYVSTVMDFGTSTTINDGQLNFKRTLLDNCSGIRARATSYAPMLFSQRATSALLAMIFKTYNASSVETERFRLGNYTDIVDLTFADGVCNLKLGTNYMDIKESSTPAAPAANTVRIYAVDNGAGKTQLMAIFATGAAQQLAIQP